MNLFENLQTYKESNDNHYVGYWDDIIKSLNNDGYEIDSAYRKPPADKETILFYKGDKTYKARVTNYFNNEYEILFDDIKEIKESYKQFDYKKAFALSVGDIIDDKGENYQVEINNIEDQEGLIVVQYLGPNDKIDYIEFDSDDDVKVYASSEYKQNGYDERTWDPFKESNNSNLRDEAIKHLANKIAKDFEGPNIPQFNTVNDAYEFILDAEFDGDKEATESAIKDAEVEVQKSRANESLETKTEEEDFISTDEENEPWFDETVQIDISADVKIVDDPDDPEFVNVFINGDLYLQEPKNIKHDWEQFAQACIIEYYYGDALDEE